MTAGKKIIPAFRIAIISIAKAWQMISIPVITLKTTK